MDGEEYLCNLSSKLAKDLEYPEASAGSRRKRVQNVGSVKAVSPVVVGDEVIIKTGEEEGMILEVLERRSVVSREHPGARHKQQVIAANVDQVLVCQAAGKPPFDPIFLDRVLAGAERQKLGSIICLNKVDLEVKDVVRERLAVYPTIGYPVVETSAIDGTGLDELRDLLTGKTTIAIGPSGVGKSSLVNGLMPGLELQVGKVNRKSGKGRHTTTNVSLVHIPSGGYYVDAPGIKELSLWEIEPDEIIHLFPEMSPLFGECKFGGGCAHDQEPGCAVKEALEDGRITEGRYENYLRLRRGADTKHEERYR